MTESKNNVKLLVKLNRSGSKVKLNSQANLSGLMAKLVMFGLPILFINYRYGLFVYKGEGYQVTGWAFTIAIIGYLGFRNSLHEWYKKNKEDLETYKRAKWVAFWLSASGFLFIGSVFFGALVELTLISALSVGLSLPFWRVYDTAIEQKNKLQPEISKESTEVQASQLKSQHNEKYGTKKI